MSEKSKQKRKVKSLTIIDLAIFVLVSLVTVVGCVCLLILVLGFVLLSNSELESEKAITRIESMLNIELPPSSKDVFYADESFGNNNMYPEIIFRFTASADEVETWLQHETFCFETLTSVSSDRMRRRDTNPDWWQPQLVENAAVDGCYHMTSPNGTQVIEIDQTNSDYWTVYFELWHY